MGLGKTVLAAGVMIGLAAMLAAKSGSTDATQKPAAAMTFDPQKAFDDGVALEALWKKAKTPGGPYPPEPSYVEKVDRALTEIPLDWSRSADAEAMVLRLRADKPNIEKTYASAEKVRLAKLATEREASLLQRRRAYARIAETNFLDGGRDYYVSTEGPESRTLRIKYILMSRPMVHQINNSATTVQAWRDLGFRSVILTDGYRESWTLKLN